MSEIDVSKCKYKTINGCSDTLSGSCVKDNCQTYRLFKQLQQLKAENEELKEKYTKQRADRILNCLDDIEEIIKELTNCGYLDLSDCIDELNAILQLIKQAKEGE